MNLRFWRRTERLPGVDEPAQPAPDDAVERPAVFPRATVILISLGGGAAAMFGLASIQSVAAPLALALVLTICAHPVRGALERISVPRGVATVLAILVVFALLAGFVAALLVALAQFTTLLPQYMPQIEQIGQDIGAWLASHGIGAETAQTIVSGFDPTKLIDIITGLLGGVTGIVFSLVVILTLVMLMAMDATYLPTLLSQLRRTSPTFVGAIVGYTVSVRRYMVAATGLGVLQSTMNFIALLILGVPAPFLWALLAFICSYIPNVGYFLAIIPPTVFGLLVGGWPTAIAVIVVYGIINVIVQSIVQPLLVSNVVALNQTLTFISVLFWTPVLGPVGAVLAVPMTLLVRAFLLDADPKGAPWRPLTGDIDEAKGIMKATDADTRQQRAARKRAGPSRNGNGADEPAADDGALNGRTL